ncbi:MAG: response regulator [Desulfobacterales bacterium]
MIWKTNRKMLQSMLEKNGYRTIAVDSGYSCIQTARDQEPDLIVLDIFLPDISGISVCRKLRNDLGLNAMPIIFVTAATDDDTLSRAYEAGGSDYIRKPVNKIELIKRVQAVFDGQTLGERKKEEEKLRSVLSMSGTICHELSQPLQYISGMAQLLLNDLEKGSAAHQKVDKMKTQIDRIAEITKKLLHLNRVDACTYIGDTKILSLNGQESSNGAF